MQEILNKAKSQTGGVYNLFVDDLKTVKTGRARPGLVEDLKVEAYESTMTLKELASITAPDPHSIIISPWDKTILKNIEKAIAVSDLHLTANMDHEVIRIIVPALTEETRTDLVKLVYQKLESARKLLRQVRNDLKNEIEDQKGKAGVSEDNIMAWLKDLQKIIDEVNTKMEALAKTKEQELMTI